MHSPSRARDPSADNAVKVSIQALGVHLGFAAIGVLFLGVLTMFWVTRAQAEVWRTPAMLPLPSGLWVSTGLLVCVSASLESARRSILVNHQERLRLGLRLGFAFAVAFLVGQVINWRHMMVMPVEVAGASLYVFMFYLLTAVHAAHVVGGLVPLGWVMVRAAHREYSSSRAAGVVFCVNYWHLLGVLWLILLASLYLADG